MKKENVKIIDSIPYESRRDMTVRIAKAFYNKDAETGEMTYTPYAVEPVFEFLFYVYCVEGIQFEADENGELEDIILTARGDEEVHNCYLQYCNGELDTHVISGQIDVIINNAKAIADFEAQKYLSKCRDVGVLIESLTRIGEYLQREEAKIQNVESADKPKEDDA